MRILHRISCQYLFFWLIDLKAYIVWIDLQGGAIHQAVNRLPSQDENEVHFSYGSVQANNFYQARRMATYKFCLNIAPDTPSLYRLFDAIATHCVPFIISDDIELPYEEDYLGSASITNTALVNNIHHICFALPLPHRKKKSMQTQTRLVITYNKYN